MTGVVLVDVAGNKFYGDVNNGKASVVVSGLMAGNYTVDVVYAGDDKYTNASTTANIIVKSKESVLPDVNVTVPSSIKAGEIINVDVKLQDDATGNVTVIVDGVETVMPLVNGSASVPLENVSAGNHSVVVVYSGDETYAPTYSTSSFSVDADPEKLVTEFADITVNEKVVTLILRDANGNTVSGANISYTIKGTVKNAVTGSDGSVSITGDYGVVINIDYAGDDTYLATNTSIKFDNAVPEILATQFNVTNGYIIQVYAVDYKAGERGAMFDVLLTDINGNRLTNQNVVFAINGWVHNKTTDANGVAHLQINLQDANKYTCAPCYLGNITYGATFASAMIVVVKKPITISAAAKTYKSTAKTKKYTVTLKTIKGSSADGKTYLNKGKKVSMKINGKTYTAKTNAKGQATFSIKLTKKGTYQTVIKFAGDNTYKSSSKSVKITIK